MFLCYFDLIRWPGFIVLSGKGVGDLAFSSELCSLLAAHRGWSALFHYALRYLKQSADQKYIVLLVCTKSHETMFFVFDGGGLGYYEKPLAMMLSQLLKTICTICGT